MIFTGKYGNIHFKMKMTYPTLPCEYHIARFPTLSRMEGSVWKTTIRWISQENRRRHSHLQSADRERMCSMSSQSSPSESYRSEYHGLTEEDAHER